jgi:hypothetical protein
VWRPKLKTSTLTSTEGAPGSIGRSG